MDGDKAGASSQIECTQDGDEWIARDLDTDECAYGSTKADALMELIALKKQGWDHSRPPAPSKKKHARRRQIQVREEISEIFHDLKSLILELKRAQEEAGHASHPFARGIRLHFIRISRMKPLHDALMYSESADTGRMNLLLITLLVGCATVSKFMIPGLVIAAETLASNEQSLIDGLKRSFETMASTPEHDSIDYFKTDKSLLQDMIVSREGKLAFTNMVLKSPLGTAGQLSNRGGASNNREGAARGALIRALNQCIPAGYNSEHGYNRFALIKQLLAIARIDASPALIRRLIHG